MGLSERTNRSESFDSRDHVLAQDTVRLARFAREWNERLRLQARAGGNRREAAARARSEVGNLKGPRRAK